MVFKTSCWKHYQDALSAVDWIMTKIVEENNRGVQWIFAKRLEDMDFADDIALLAQRQPDMQGKTDDVVASVRQIGLEANVS